MHNANLNNLAQKSNSIPTPATNKKSHSRIRLDLSQHNTLLSNTVPYPVEKDSKPNYWNEPWLKDHRIELSVEQGLKARLGINAYCNNDYAFSIFPGSIKLYDSDAAVKNNFVPERSSRDIVRFSKNSRLRLLRLCSHIHLKAYQDVLHCTITYHNVYPSTEFELKKHFHHFWVSINRQFPDLHFIWRLEFQKRGAPHFHIIFLSPHYRFSPNSAIMKARVTRIWTRIINDFDADTIAHSVKITRVDTWELFFSYVSKYSAKEEEFNCCQYHMRRWGHSSNLKLVAELRHTCSKEFLALFRRRLIDYFTHHKRVSEKFISVIQESRCVELFIESSVCYDICNECIKQLNEIPQYELPDWL